MECNEQTELTSKIDRLIDREQDDSYCGVGGQGVEESRKRTHGHGQQCGDCGWEGVIRGLNANGNNTIQFI